MWVLPRESEGGGDRGRGYCSGICPAAAKVFFIFEFVAIRIQKMHCWWLLLFAQFPQLTRQRPELPPECNQFEWKWQPSSGTNVNGRRRRSQSRSRRQRQRQNHNQKRVAFSIIPAAKQCDDSLHFLQLNGTLWYDDMVCMMCMVYAWLYGMWHVWHLLATQSKPAKS